MHTSILFAKQNKMSTYRIMAYILMFLMATGAVSAIDKLPSLSGLLIGRDVQIEDGGKTHLPSSIYSVSGAIQHLDSENILSADIGEADLDLINTVNHNSIEYRARRIPAQHKITEVAGYSCSINPDLSGSIITGESQTKICYTNEDKPGAVFRLWDIENDMAYVGEKALNVELRGDGVSVNVELRGCFVVEPDHQYLYDVLFCAGESCHCTSFANNYCQENEGQFQMLRTRDCSPDNCDIQKTWVDWVDTKAPGCEDVRNYCRETDLGLDYIHYGKTIKGSTTSNDICISEERVKEYYCNEGEIDFKYHYCLTNQECVKGECITKPDLEDDCGIVDGKLRQGGQEWCLGVTKKTCIDGKIELEYMDADCTTASCDYNGIIFGVGESVCMNNGFTIATCQDPINPERMFNYRSCPDDTECNPNSQLTECNEIKIEVVESTIMPTRITLWAWFKNLFGGSK